MHPARAPQTAALSGFSFDWNNAAEQSVAGLLGLVPEVGPILSALAYIFWPPTQVDVWGEIELYVQLLIQQDLSQLVQTQVAASLEGLKNNIASYLVALQDGTGDPSYISEKWNVANGDFLQQLPTFQLAGYQVLLLPLFAQFANMHLSLLRDGVIGGSNWGWTPAIIAQTQIDLTDAIAAYTKYAQLYYQSGLIVVEANTFQNNHNSEPFRTVNGWVRSMTLMVLDFMNLWQYFDVSKYPNGATVVLDREVYSDPQGTCDDTGPIVLPAPPTQPISQITVWGGDRVDGVQVSYPAGGGPGGVTTTPIMGTKADSDAPPHGGVFQVSDNPVVVASGASGDILNAMSFTFADGSTSNTLGGNYPGGGPFSWSFQNEILSSIHINGVSVFYGSADCVVFGFQFAQPQTVSPSMRQMLYITAPVLPAKLVSAADANPQARESYWNYVASQVKS